MVKGVFWEMFGDPPSILEGIFKGRRNREHIESLK